MFFEKLIRQLGAEATHRLDVFNKSDVYVGDIRPHGEDIVSISALTGEGLGLLLEKGARLTEGGGLPSERGLALMELMG